MHQSGGFHLGTISRTRCGFERHLKLRRSGRALFRTESGFERHFRQSDFRGLGLGKLNDKVFRAWGFKRYVFNGELFWFLSTAFCCC